MGPGATRPTPGGRFAWRALGGAAVAAGLFGCVDLFHSTDFGVAGGVCDDAGVCVAPDAGGDGGSVKKRDGGADAGVGDGGVRDGTVDHGGTGDGGRDGKGGTDGSVGPDGGQETGAPPNFCSLSPATAAKYAEQACRLLGACVGNLDLNEYGVCYTNARLAYDCSLNPNQRVRGALYTYWDALSKATTCDDVLAAIFPAGVPVCTSSGASCGTDLTDGGRYANVVVACGDGGFSSAVNCQMRGYSCVSGVCGNGGAACTATPTASCAGNTLRSCQLVEIDAGSATGWVDVGRDCTNFGGGNCVQQAATGAYGCLPNDPNDASIPCAPSPAVSCTPLDGGGGFVTGCASGYQENVPCSAFATGTTCNPDGGWAASSRDLVGGCFNPAVLRLLAGDGTCTAGGGFTDNAGASGPVQVDCPDSGGFEECRYNATGEPYCPR